jgi:hypothetical protein
LFGLVFLREREKVQNKLIYPVVDGPLAAIDRIDAPPAFTRLTVSGYCRGFDVGIVEDSYEPELRLEAEHARMQIGDLLEKDTLCVLVSVWLIKKEVDDTILDCDRIPTV